MRKTGTERRNLLVLLAMTTGMAVLVVFAQGQGDIRIMPPEPAELAAKRKSPDNAFFTLRSARDQAHKLIAEQEHAEPAGEHEQQCPDGVPTAPLGGASPRDAGCRASCR